MTKRRPPTFNPTEEQRKLVERSSAVGLTAEQISKVIGIGETTLWKYFKTELEQGGIKANAAVAGALYNSAMRGNVTAQIFWCKTRLKWKEVHTHELTGEDGGAINIIFRRKDA